MRNQDLEGTLYDNLVDFGGVISGKWKYLHFESFGTLRPVALF